METKAAHQKVSPIKDLKFGQTFFTAVVALDLIYANIEAFFWSADDEEEVGQSGDTVLTFLGLEPRQQKADSK